MSVVSECCECTCVCVCACECVCVCVCCECLSPSHLSVCLSLRQSAFFTSPKDQNTLAFSLFWGFACALEVVLFIYCVGLASRHGASEQNARAHELSHKHTDRHRQTDTDTDKRAKGSGPDEARCAEANDVVLFCDDVNAGPVCGHVFSDSNVKDAAAKTSTRHDLEQLPNLFTRNLLSVVRLLPFLVAEENGGCGMVCRQFVCGEVDELLFHFGPVTVKGGGAKVVSEGRL